MNPAARCLVLACCAAAYVAQTAWGQAEWAPLAPPQAVSADASIAAAGALAHGRELWNLWGITDERWQQVSDGGEITVEDHALLGRLLEGCGRLEPEDIERLVEPAENAIEWQSEPEQARGRLFALRGRVVSVRSVEWPGELQERLAGHPAWRVELVSEDRGSRFTVFAREVPRAWQLRETWDEPAECLGFFVKRSSPGSPDLPHSSAAVWVARRVAWHPATPLGVLGMDVGLLDTVEQRARLTSTEREAFFEVLAAVGRSAKGALLQAAGAESDSVVPLFNRPAEQVGRRVALSGIARRVVTIELRNAARARRVGLERYYEVELFTDDSQGSPLVCCVRNLPPGMPTGEGLHEAVRVAGFFFKVWAYEVPVPPEQRSTPDGAETRLQLAPLIIGRDLEWQPPSGTTARSVWPALLAGGLLLVGWGWWAHAAWRRRGRRSRAGGAERPDFSGIRTNVGASATDDASASPDRG